MPITGTTRMLGLIGNPVEHSKSPAMYNYCFRKYGLDWAYLAFPISVEKTEDAIQALRTLNMWGANVTMPCKSAVLPYLDYLTPAAKAIGAVNTIVNDGGVLTGHNTDGFGYTENLRRHSVSVSGKKIVLLGGGGAATAIAAQAALEDAAELRVFNLKDAFWPKLEESMSRIRAAAPNCKITLHDLADQALLREKIESADILSNATRVGMAPDEDGCLIPSPEWLRKDLIVTDVVYAPSETKLLRKAREMGCLTCDGLGMLLCQGAEAFRLYSGLEMPVDEIRKLLYA